MSNLDKAYIDWAQGIGDRINGLLSPDTQKLEHGFIDWASGVGDRIRGLLYPDSPEGEKVAGALVRELTGINPETKKFETLPGMYGQGLHTRILDVPWEYPRELFKDLIKKGVNPNPFMWSANTIRGFKVPSIQVVENPTAREMQEYLDYWVRKNRGQPATEVMRAFQPTTTKNYYAWPADLGMHPEMLDALRTGNAMYDWGLKLPDSTYGYNRFEWRPGEPWPQKAPWE
jgi:hypothetical protein